MDGRRAGLGGEDGTRNEGAEGSQWKKREEACKVEHSIKGGGGH